jgi:hypothetical protein
LGYVTERNPESDPPNSNGSGRNLPQIPAQAQWPPTIMDRDAGEAVTPVADQSEPVEHHAGTELCRLLAQVPEVVDVETLGCEELPGGTLSYSVGVMLPGGRELLIDVQML